MLKREFRLAILYELIETEAHDSHRVDQLVEKIKKTKNWTVPIAVESSTNAIMDGHHRLQAAKILGFKRVPCYLMDYIKGGVVLRSWRLDEEITIDNFFTNVRKKTKFPIKTTRHIFNPSIEEVNIPIDFLY